MSKENESDRQIESIEGMVRALENSADAASSLKAKELMQALMTLHGACLERMLEIVKQTGTLGQAIIDSFAADEKVRSLLLLYDLHPLDMETRILQALEKTRPYLRSHGGSVNLISVDPAGIVTLRLEGSPNGCASSSATLKSVVEQAVYDAAPDVTAIHVEGSLAEQKPAPAFVPLTALQTGNPTIPPHSERIERSAT
jgi:Fe-S cluster biogenesis protein NfuA